MATFRATFAIADNSPGQKGHGSDTNPVLLASSALGLDELTTSGTSQIVEDGASDWSAPRDGYITAVCDGAIWIKVAASPTAAVADAFFVTADERFEFAIREGEKIAVIDDS